MKETATLIFLLYWFPSDSSGQWYKRKYNVSDIDFLTREQFEEAKQKTGNSKYVSLISRGLGGAVFLPGRLMPYVPEDELDPVFLEQLPGDYGMHKVVIGSGICLTGAGTILNCDN